MQENQLMDLINANNGKADLVRAGKVICIIDNKKFFIGDSVVNFSYLRALSAYLSNGTFDLFTTPLYHSLLVNNPFINRVFFDLEAVAFETYDLIFFFSTNEREYLAFLAGKYKDLVSRRRFKPAVFSLVYFPDPEHTPLLPLYNRFLSFVREEYPQQRTVKGQELFLSPGEKAWGETWLRQNGVGEDEKVVVLLDSSTSKDKILHLPVHFEIADYFRRFDKVKILVFDEQDIGKEQLYHEWLGNEAAGDFLFAKGLSLRQALCLLASDCTKVVFGPCTGLLHCASGIYNTFRHSQVPFEHVPVMITYIGPDESHNKWGWWGESLVDCIYLVSNARGEREIRRLTGPEYECLPCAAYTAELLIDYLNEHYLDPLAAMGISVKSAAFAAGQLYKHPR